VGGREREKLEIKMKLRRDNTEKEVGSTGGV
jgi:hypothetical protein